MCKNKSTRLYFIMLQSKQHLIKSNCCNSHQNELLFFSTFFRFYFVLGGERQPSEWVSECNVKSSIAHGSKIVLMAFLTTILLARSFGALSRILFSVSFAWFHFWLQPNTKPSSIQSQCHYCRHLCNQLITSFTRSHTVALYPKLECIPTAHTYTYNTKTTESWQCSCLKYDRNVGIHQKI